MFELFFNRSGDPMWLFDAQQGVFVDCNQAAVELMRCESQAELLRARPADWLRIARPTGSGSAEVDTHVLASVDQREGGRMEWLARRFDGTEVVLEVMLTPISAGGRTMHVVVARDVSERKRVDEALRQLNATLERRIAERTAQLAASEERARILLEHAPEAIVVFDGESGRFLSCNENAAQLYGLPRERLLNLTPAEVSPLQQPDGRSSGEAAWEWIRQALEGRAPVFEWMHVHASGRPVPCEIRLVRLPAEGRQLVRASITDNTRRYRREQIQRATYEISEAVHTAVNLSSLYARIHQIIKGLMPAENFYIALLDPDQESFSFPYFVDQRDRSPAPLRITEGLTGYVLRTGKPLVAGDDNIERPGEAGIAMVKDAGAESLYREVGTPAAVWLGVPLNIQGKPFGVMALQDYESRSAYGEEEKRILMFVAEQTALAIQHKRAEQDLKQRHREVSTLLDSLPGYAFFKDAQGRYLRANQNFCRALGVTGECISGKTDAELFPAALARKYSQDDSRLLRLGETLEVGEEEMMEEGRRFVVETTKVPVKNGRGEVVGIIGLGFDVTKRKAAEAELLKSLAREKELSQLKSNFVSMVSHEFRTPLGIIMSSSEILEDYFEQLGVQERKEHLEAIQNNTRRMADLMEEVLVLSRFDAGKMDFRPAPVDLNGFCLRLTEEVLSATDQRCPIRVQFGEGTTPAEADERLLHHIFTNLLSNAVKYSETGCPVEFRVERDHGDAVCVVRDQGIGIPESDRPWLFNAFHRGSNTGARPGSGLGLLIVKRCVELHGGRIAVASQVGEGTAFTVRLPVFPESAGPGAQAATTQE